MSRIYPPRGLPRYAHSASAAFTNSAHLPIFRHSDTSDDYYFIYGHIKHIRKYYQIINSRYSISTHPLEYRLWSIESASYLHIRYFEPLMMINGRNETTGKPLSRKTAVHHLSFISDVFTYAIRMGMLSDNPCRRVFVPKQEQLEKEIFTLDEVRTLFANLDNEPMKYQLYLMLAIYSGFRRSEMLGLEWKDIDFENDLIHVRRTSQYTAEKGIYTDTTKTRSSKRVSKMPEIIMDLLRRFRTEQTIEARRLGTNWVENDRLFTKWNGEPMNPQTPFEWLKGYCGRVGVPFKNIHSLRHLHASLLIFEGVDVVAVSADMGHSVVGTTLNLYSHMF